MVAARRLCPKPRDTAALRSSSRSLVEFTVLRPTRLPRARQEASIPPAQRVGRDHLRAQILRRECADDDRDPQIPVTAR